MAASTSSSTAQQARGATAGTSASPFTGVNLGGTDIESIAAKLSDPTPSTDPQAKIKLASDLRDQIELQRDVDHHQLFEVLLPCFIDILRNGKPSLASNSNENRLRQTILQILHRIPHVEALRPHAHQLMQLLLALVRTENEENASMCLKIIIDLHRSYGKAPPGAPAPGTNGEENPVPTVEDTAQDLLEVIADMFRGMPAVVDSLFSSPSSSSTSTAGGGGGAASTPADSAQSPAQAEDVPASLGGTSATTPAVLPQGMKSIKTLAECPTGIVFIIQAYRQLVPRAVEIFVPLLFDFLRLQAQPQARAHQQAREQGRIFIGVSSEITKDKRAAYVDFVLAQIKTLSFLAYLIRIAMPTLTKHASTTAEVTVRLLQDCPPESNASRKELLVATRHVLQTDLRSAFITHIDTLLHDDVLIGGGLASYEHLRPLAYSILADLLHHIRAELSLPQIARIVHIYSGLLQDPTLGFSIQTMCSKLLSNLVERLTQMDPHECRAMSYRILTALVEKSVGIAEFRGHFASWMRPSSSRDMPSSSSSKGKGKEQSGDSPVKGSKDDRPGKDAKDAEGEDKPDDKGKGKEKDDGDDERAPEKDADAMQVDEPQSSSEGHDLDEVDIERSRIIGRTAMLTDPAIVDPLKDTRFLFKNLLSAIRTVANIFGKWPNADLLGKFFEATVKSFAMYDPSRDRDNGREQKEVLDLFCSIIINSDPLTFQEVLESRMSFFCDELIINNELLAIPQTLLSSEVVSQPFVAIVFRFLSARLAELGKSDRERSTVMLRLFKMSFMAVTIFPEKNEPVLLPHLSHLIMHSLKLANTAEDPSSYYLLLRALFRSIGGGRFEILYKEVLPLLQLLLERLNALLRAADKSKRDIFVELCLTVPVRLSVLLPYLSYLMRPLVYALQATPELISQGLRTLELCVDNLTQEFLNPIMAPVIDEIMAALWKLLRPLPFNAAHAHATMRILGKIGGRNRKNYSPPPLQWKPVADECLLDVKFGFKNTSIRLAPMIELALKTIRRGDMHYRRNAFGFFKYTVVLFLNEGHGLPAGEVEESFGNLLRGLFEATRIDDFTEEANKYMIDLAEYIFNLELSKKMPESQIGKDVLPLCSALLDGVIDNLASAESSELNRAADQTTSIVKILRKAINPEAPRPDPALVLLYQLASRLSSLCYDPSWQKKTGAAMGISVLLWRADLDIKWILDHEVEFVRALLFALKDVPADAPPNVDLMSKTLLEVLRMCNEPGVSEDTPTEKAKLNYLVGLLLIELCSQVASVRENVKAALKILSESTNTTLTDLLRPVRERLLQPIFTKPLRALAFSMQIGHIDAITFCIAMDPPLIDMNDQLTRLLHEALGIADADDAALVGQKPTAKTLAPLKQLRVVCVELLTTALSSPELLSSPKHQPMKLRTISVYFKLLYSSSPEVVEAAYQGLRAVMQIQGKLPKDLLQNGLKPVLMNLSDHKKLSVASLEGLARLLELLPNYFKVEIGQKLLDHFRNLNIPSEIFRGSPRLAVPRLAAEDKELEIMAAIINIFHLLPHPAAAVFLDEVVKQVVEVERYLKIIRDSPFTTPLAKYLNRYPAEATNHIFGRVSEERSIPTFRAVIASPHAADLRSFISSAAQSQHIFMAAFQSEGDVAYHAALLIKELVDVDPEWMSVTCPGVLNMLIERWVSDIRRQRLVAQGEANNQQLREDGVIVELFTSHLRRVEHIDILFHLCDVFQYPVAQDRTSLRRFLIEHVALSRNQTFKRALLDRFVDIFENRNVTKPHKTAALRHLVNPVLLVAFARGASEAKLIDAEYIGKIDARVWQPMLHDPPEQSTLADDSLRIELLQLSTMILKSCPDLVAERRKNVIKFGWANIKVDDILVKHAAHVLIARFLDAYDSPSKIVIQIYVALLRAKDVEARGLVREALDILAPALPRRVPSSGEASQSLWAKWTRRILVEETNNNIQQIVNVYQLLCRHVDLFFPSRDLFIQQLIASLSKLTLTPAIAVEPRQLTLDLMELVLKWERKRIELAKQDEKGEKQEGMDVDADPETSERSPKRPRLDRSTSVAPSTTSTSQGAGYVVPHNMREHLVSTLLRMIASPAHGDVPRSSYVPRALMLLREFLSPTVWSDVNVKLSFFQRSFSHLENLEAQALGPLCSSAEVLNIVVSHKSDDWVMSHLGILQKIVENGYGTSEPRLLAQQRPLLERLFEVVRNKVSADAAAEEQPELKTFVEWATNSINDGLRPDGPLTSTLGILTAWARASPERIDGFIQPIIRVLSRLVKDHISSSTPVPTNDPQIRLLVSCLELLRQRVGQLGNDRRWYLSAMVQLVEKSSNIDLCRFLLQNTRKSVMDKNEQYPTAKEKAGLLSRMQSFEARGNEGLMREYLSLILDIYQDPAFARSELCVRLENSFLLGCRNRDPTIRTKFLDLLDKSIPVNLYTRLNYLLGVQSWETIADWYWIHQALDLLWGAIDRTGKLYTEPSTATIPDSLSDFVTQVRSFTSGDLVDVSRRLLYADPVTTHTMWLSTFSSCWSLLTHREQQEMTRFLVSLLTKDYHMRNIDRRPNVVSTLLGGALACTPSPSLPPHVVRYLSKTFNGWHAGLELLQEVLDDPREDEAVREMTLDALAELYSELGEDDLFYGLWRRRAGYSETNAAISWEQIGQWAQAQILYESAQLKARSGVLPFTESEMALWEDHWIVTAQKLQQWDILTELARNEGNKELFLECAWRLSDWSAERATLEENIESMSPTPTPRRRVFEAFLTLLKGMAGKSLDERRREFVSLCDAGIQLSLRKWFYLPEYVSQAHVPLLHVFQQFVELSEAQQIFHSLIDTDATNLDGRSQELKNVLQTWRERLPNLWDDINIWSDLVAWRQHVFSAINKAYLPLVPSAQNGGGNASSFAYRGFHETAWIINRFAHVARKHQLHDVCITSLTKIYTLPNIEIQEAFLKLREQAKCHYQNPSELQAGLEVINNTNLMYFGPAQKAEFFTLKGMFLAKLNLADEANQIFNQAVSMDMTFPKAWAKWGEYNDRMFKSNPQDLSIAADAVSCYLQAAGLYKNAKSRPLLIRILWLLGLDDSTGTVAKAFDGYKGEVPVWYWITFIPQLLLSLSQREARYARILLMNIAKAYPQALFFPLRTIREDLSHHKRQHQQQQAAARAAAAAKAGGDGNQESAEAQQQDSGTTPPNAPHRYPWEHVEEIMSILKTAFPLLALSMEMIVDQISQRFKPAPDEDIYRLISALLNDVLPQYINRASQPNDDGQLPQATVANVARFASNLHPEPLRERFSREFVQSKPNIREFVERLQQWRDRYEAILKKKTKVCALESASHWLVEFQYQKFDEIEIPGQYLKHEDNNLNFVHISHFSNKFEVARSHGIFFRRLTIVGHDGTLHRFATQLPSTRSSRREERIMQLFRILNTPLSTKKEARRRNLAFHVPIVVPLAPGVRLIENDSSVVSLQDVFEQHCETIGMSRDASVLAHTDRLRALGSHDPPLSRHDMLNAKLELAEEIAAKMIPDDVLKKYMIKAMSTPSDLWHVRRQMTLYMASFIFMTYVMSIGGRIPARIHISRSSGKIHTTEMVPSLSMKEPQFLNQEPVPFRFTPNFQRFISPVGTEGLLTSSIMAIARSLTEMDDFESRLSIFVREEMMNWSSLTKNTSSASSSTTSASGGGGGSDQPQRGSLRELVVSNIDEISRRAKILSCKMEREKPLNSSTPVNQTLLELLSQAANAQRLAATDPLWYAQL